MTFNKQKFETARLISRQKRENEYRTSVEKTMSEGNGKVFIGCRSYPDLEAAETIVAELKKDGFSEACLYQNWKNDGWFICWDSSQVTDSVDPLMVFTIGVASFVGFLVCVPIVVCIMRAVFRLFNT